jgi:putative ABC transport system permease protein
MKDKDYIWKLIARKLSGEATAQELKELEALLKNNPENQYTLFLLASLWNPEESPDATPVAEATEHFLLRLREIPTPPRVSWHQPSPRPRWLPTGSLLRTQAKTTYRNLMRSKGFSLVNIFGLALGMASAILLLLVIHNQLTFDRIYPHEDRLYQVMNKAFVDGNLESWGGTPQALTPVLKTDFPEVEKAARVSVVGSLLFNVGDNHLRSWGYLTDPAFLDLFGLPFLEGDPATALDKPHSIVLTQALSKKLFGDQDPLGQTISLDSNVLFTVTGVMKPLPPNTRFNCEYIVPWSYMKEIGWENHEWMNNNCVTYVRLRQGITKKTMDSLLAGVTTAHDPTVKNRLFLHPAWRWALYSNFVNGESTAGGLHFVQTLILLAAFLLLIACINYMNLSTARSMRRAREVGIRKVMGAGKTALVLQFLGESVLIAFVSGVLALGLAQANLGWFDKLLFVKLFIPYGDSRFWVWALAFTLFTGLVAGSYPAFYLSGFQPIQVLKGTFKTVFALVTPRKVLVVFQFTIAIALVICTIIVFRQIWYARQRSSGYDQERLLFVYINGDIRNNYDSIRSGLLSSDAVTNLCRTNSPVTEAWSDVTEYGWEGKQPQTRFDFTRYMTDRNFASTVGLKVLAGRDIDLERYSSDSNAIVLTESAFHTMGFKHPLGQVITLGPRHLHVIGVVRDFIHGSPYWPAWPTVIEAAADPSGKSFGVITFRMNPVRTPEDNLTRIKAVFKKYNGDYPFEYKFVNEQYDMKFEDETHFGTLAALFSGLSICISFLGLFALAAYMAESRIREIGIRRVLGASIASITTLLSKDFVKLVGISFTIASALAWWAMRAWLSEYAYRVSMTWWLFALTGLFALIVTVATVSYQAVMAARARPAESLKVE